MKKLLTIIACISGLGTALAQPTYTVSPPTFTAEDNITITVDVSNTTLKDYSGKVWMWAWIAEGCSSSCDAPTNVNPANDENAKDAEMTRDPENANKYSISLVPSDFYGKAPSEIKKMGFKLKSADWGDGKQSDSDVVLNVEPLIFVPKINRIFPTKVTKDDVVTLYLDQTQALNLDLKYAITDFTVTVTAYDDEDALLGTLEDVDVVNAGNGLHYLRIIPTFNFESANVNSIKYRFTGKTVEIQSDEFSLVFFK